MSCSVGRRHNLDLVLLCLWCRPVATALIGALAWELPYASGAALKKKQNTHTHKKEGGVNRDSLGSGLALPMVISRMAVEARGGLFPSEDRG